MICRVWMSIILVSCYAGTAPAKEIYDAHTNVRALGMGNAYAAIVSDEESLWYNPAGIAKNGGFFWTILDPRGGISGLDAIDQFADLADDASFADTLNDLYGKPIWGGGGAKTSIIMPFLSAAYYYDAEVSLFADNPVNPTLSAGVVYDEGIALGTGWSVAGIFQMGFVARYVTRTGARKEFGAATIAPILEGTDSPDVIFDEFDNSGVGYGLDMGINFTIPSPVRPTFSFVWKNIGNTKFKASSGSKAPPTEVQDMTVGAALEVDLPGIDISPVFEIRHLNDNEYQLGQKLHMGVELSLPLIDLRAGLYQGYYTAGVGLNMGLIKLDAATWGVEMGGYPGQLESRRYMVQATLCIGLDLGLGGGGAGSSRGERGGSSSSGIFGKKKLKQRR